MSEAPSPEELRTWTGQQLVDAFHGQEWMAGDRTREALEDEIERRGIAPPVMLTPTPEALASWTEEELVNEWGLYGQDRSDPRGKALMAEIDRRRDNVHDSPRSVLAPEAVRMMPDAALLAEWDEVSREPGDPWSDSMSIEIERRHLDF